MPKPQRTFHASAASPERSDVGLNAGRSLQLVRHEVGVVGGVDEVGGEGLRHVLVHTTVLNTHHVSLIAQKVLGETCTRGCTYSLYDASNTMCKVYVHSITH